MKHKDVGFLVVFLQVDWDEDQVMDEEGRRKGRGFRRDELVAVRSACALRCCARVCRPRGTRQQKRTWETFAFVEQEGTELDDEQVGT